MITSFISAHPFWSYLIGTILIAEVFYIMHRRTQTDMDDWFETKIMLLFLSAILLGLLVCAYFFIAMVISLLQPITINWIDVLRVMIIIIAIVLYFILNYFIAKKLLRKKKHNHKRKGGKRK